MKNRNARWGRSSVFAFLGVVLWGSDSFSGTGEQGFTQQGFTQQGFAVQGFTQQGFTQQGFTQQGFTQQGFTQQGLMNQGFTQQGFTQQGFTQQGFAIQGFTQQGFTQQGFTQQGFTQQGFTQQGSALRGIDRLRGMGGPMEYLGIAFADVQTGSGVNLQGIQPVSPLQPITYVQPGSVTARLQASPTDTAAGDYIFVSGLSGATQDIKGSLWNMVLADSTGTGAIGLYVADVAKDTASNLSKYSANDDIYLYTVYYRHPSTAQWVSLCPFDEKTGKASAMAMPLDSSDWTSDASRAKFTFACTASGVGSKCARNWGYKPWKTVQETVWNGSAFVSKAIPLKPFYDSCIIAARADYCQDGQSYTKNGTLVDLFDTLDGFTSLNPTAGLPYTPGSPGVMMHEEYQISALDLMSVDSKPFYAVSASDPILMSLSPADQAALLAVRRSGMETSRYADLDPGRSCLAAPYVDRCSPHEPYACYRDANMSANSYGAFLAVNSPRHCDHDEDHDGAPLDPLCNLCVTRVCSVDPTCCGDPGSTFYPGSLVWDGRCTAIRNSVCKNPGDTTPWTAGNVAPAAGSKPVIYLRGAVGSLESITTVAGTQYAEGWACDPDFPGASSFIQISMGGPMGAANTTLTTAMADAPLAAGWSNAVTSECGGAGRHGFRVALPTLPAGSDGNVYVYGIDLNTPGAPFSLLRGGKKVVPPTALLPPRAAIWSGWIEPTVTGAYQFSVVAGPSDSYRVWVNGTYVAGNWIDPDPTVPGAFLLPPPSSPPSLSLRAGVRYGVRIEYRRSSVSDGSSQLRLQWTVPGPSTLAVDVPFTALYPMAQGSGNGLQGTYFDGSGVQKGQSVDAVDFVWTSCRPPASAATCKPPAAGLEVENPFTATFDGQVMPPVSGNYTFTADTDGAASIWVNGQLVTDATRRPPGTGDPGKCGQRDICSTGAAISRTCDQGYFCAGQICLNDPACCSITWDARCLQEVSTVCHLDCRPTPPLAIALQAGVKYDIKVTVQHEGGGSRFCGRWTAARGRRSPRIVCSRSRVRWAKGWGSTPPTSPTTNGRTRSWTTSSRRLRSRRERCPPSPRRRRRSPADRAAAPVTSLARPRCCRRPPTRGCLDRPSHSWVRAPPPARMSPYR